jgi:hypothetical protein
MLQKGRVTKYTDVDIMNRIRAVAESRPYLEDRCGVRALTCSGVIAVSPESLFSRLPVCVSDASKYACVMIAYAAASKSEFRPVHYATLPVEGETVTELELEATIDMLEHSDMSLETCTYLVSESFPVLLTLDALGKDDELRAVYNNPPVATAFALRRLFPGEACDPSSLDIEAGPEFIRSVEAHNIHRQDALLFALYSRIALAVRDRLHEINGAKLHAVRTSESANAAQVQRTDGAKLWRCMISKKGAGYRLQYWSLNGQIELDRVTTEDSV